MSKKLVHVAVGVVCQLDPSNESDLNSVELATMGNQQFFLTKRHHNAHQGGKWEFPGGKVEQGETVAQALHRELKEEIAIDVLACQPLIQINHDYGDKQVLLDVYIVDQFLGEPSAQEAQQQQGWFTLAELSELDFPKANEAIITKLMNRA